MARNRIRYRETAAMRILRLLTYAMLIAGSVRAASGYAQDPLEQKIGPPAPANEPGLLFYLSGDRGFNADERFAWVSLFVEELR